MHRTQSRKGRCIKAQRGLALINALLTLLLVATVLQNLVPTQNELQSRVDLSLIHLAASTLADGYRVLGEGHSCLGRHTPPPGLSACLSDQLLTDSRATFYGQDNQWLLEWQHGPTLAGLCARGIPRDGQCITILPL
ncbi:hypothetical protein OAS86_00535 [Gammaproteobacteria bacterium]|nr:hypothetical protein [Gammaproteobacteria bacterium]